MNREYLFGLRYKIVISWSQSIQKCLYACVGYHWGALSDLGGGIIVTSANNDTESSTSETLDMPCETRYRTSRYFQEDRLRCSEAAADLRMMKDLMDSLASIGLQPKGKVLAFQPVIISSKRH